MVPDAVDCGSTRKSTEMGKGDETPSATIIASTQTETLNPSGAITSPSTGPNRRSTS